MQGIFITFEGPDGAGKTSVLKEVSERLAKESKRKIVTTKRTRRHTDCRKDSNSYFRSKK